MKLSSILTIALGVVGYASCLGGSDGVAQESPAMAALPSLGCVKQNFLMLHCAGFHGVAYRRIATELSDRLGGRCRVLAPDFRGHGDTPRGPKAR